MVRTAADRWKRVKRAPLDLLKAAAAQPFDDNSLLGQAAVLRAKRAKRHKPSTETKKAVLILITIKMAFWMWTTNVRSKLGKPSIKDVSL